LIIDQIVTYYDKCCSWHKGLISNSFPISKMLMGTALVSRTQPHPKTEKRLKMSAYLNESADVKTLLRDIMNADESTRQPLIEQEINHLLTTMTDIDISETDLLLERRSIASLCLLTTSTKWLASKMAALRYLSPQATEASKRHSERYDRARRWTLITATQSSEPDRVYLPLTEETSLAFDAAQKSFEDLSAEALRLLHLEIRTQTLFYTRKSMQRSFLMDQELDEPDPEVVALNAALVGLDSELSTHLFPTQQAFIVTGLAALLDSTILSLSSTIPAMNAAGCSRIQLNILVLQQNLKNVEMDASLRKAVVYFDLFRSGPDEVVKEAKRKGKECGFSLEMMQRLVELCYSEKRRSERREEAVAAERGVEGHKLQLTEFLW